MAVPTILIVDDHPSFRASANAILTADGFEVVGEAEDGESRLPQQAACIRTSCSSTSSFPTSMGSRSHVAC